jgi:hypothetical protein
LETPLKSFRGLTALVVAWSSDAAPPDSLNGRLEILNFLNEAPHSVDQSLDIVVFGVFQTSTGFDRENRQLTMEAGR